MFRVGVSWVECCEEGLDYFLFEVFLWCWKELLLHFLLLFVRASVRRCDSNMSSNFFVWPCPCTSPRTTSLSQLTLQLQRIQNSSPAGFTLNSLANSFSYAWDLDKLLITLGILTESERTECTRNAKCLALKYKCRIKGRGSNRPAKRDSRFTSHSAAN